MSKAERELRSRIETFANGLIADHPEWHQARLRMAGRRLRELLGLDPWGTDPGGDEEVKVIGGVRWDGSNLEFTFD